MRVSVIGQGYFGLKISAFASRYFEVVVFDLTLKIVLNLKAGISHIEGVHSKAIKDGINVGNYRATTAASVYLSHVTANPHL